MKNEWTDVPGYNGMYQAHPDGRIRKIQELKPLLHRNGYAMVSFSVENHPRRRLWHRVIAETFLGYQSSRMDVNHKDCVKTNNALCNLEWVTRSENMMHAKAMGRMKNCWRLASERWSGSKNPNYRGKLKHEET